MEQNQTPKYATLFYDTRAKLNITWLEYIILDMVYHLQAKTGYCYKTSSKIGEDLGEDKRAVQYILQKLIKQGLLERLTDYTVRVTDKYIDIAILTKGTKNLYPIPKTSTKGTNHLYKGTKNRQNNRGLELHNNNKNAPVVKKDGAGYKAAKATAEAIKRKKPHN